jgi:hypothetical protein
LRCIEFNILPKTISGKIHWVDVNAQEKARAAAGHTAALEFLESSK